jgi:hypothetical protein
MAGSRRYAHHRHRRAGADHQDRLTRKTLAFGVGREVAAVSVAGGERSTGCPSAEPLALAPTPRWNEPSAPDSSLVSFGTSFFWHVVLGMRPVRYCPPVLACAKHSDRSSPRHTRRSGDCIGPAHGPRSKRCDGPSSRRTRWRFGAHTASADHPRCRSGRFPARRSRAIGYRCLGSPACRSP